MIERIIGLAIQRRWVVVTLAAIAMFLGGLALTRLPIDAVPDITNKQVQINTVAPALSPAEIEKQITFPIETALAGAPGLESTRSLSRNGFSQITAVFSEATDIYFARQQVGERLTEVRARLPQGIEPRIGPTSTGLGEIYMWTVHYSGQKVQADGAPGLQSDGRFLTADGQMLQSEVEKDAYLRTVQDWIIKPQIKMVPGVAGVDTIGGYLKQYQVHPDAAKLIALGLTFADVAKAIETNNVSRGARYIERNGEGFVVRSGGRLENIDELGAVVVTTRGGVPVRIRDLATLSIGGETRTGSASENGREVVVGTALMLIGANSRTVSAAGSTPNC
ncbi:Cu/Ag efflux pump CusA [Bradyrhizobium sp. USDA 4512]